MIRLVLCDVDGVLTDGSIRIDDAGREIKTFHVHDGSAAAHLRQVGKEVGIVTGRRSRATLARAREMRVTELFQGVRDKLAVVEEISRRRGIPLAEMAYIGDDLLDLNPLMAVGLSCAPADARPEVKARVEYVCDTPGGRGVLREVAAMIIRREGLEDDLMARYVNAPGDPEAGAH